MRIVQSHKYFRIIEAGATVSLIIIILRDELREEKSCEEKSCEEKSCEENLKNLRNSEDNF